MSKIVLAKREDGYWLVEPYNHAPIMENEKSKYGEDIAGPFDAKEEAEDFCVRMDYIYE